MTTCQNRTGSRHTWPIVFGIVSLLACADTLSGPNECVFAYDIDPASLTIQLGDSTVVRAIPAANCGAPQTVTWRVEDTSKATVRSTGNLTAVVHGVAIGTTLLNAENGDKSGFALVEVK